MIINVESDARLKTKLAVIRKENPSDTSHTRRYEWNELGMAELFAGCYEAETRYCSENKTWYTYADGIWQKDIGGLLVTEKVKEFVRLMAVYAAEIESDEHRQKFFVFVSKMGDRRFRDRLKRDAESLLSIHAKTFDSTPYLINCINGTFDLGRMVFRKHDWKDFITMQTRIKYREGYSCVRWERFMQEITQNDEEKMQYLQSALGYSMLGINKEECMFILYGKSTRNGKSTLLGALTHLLGDYATVAPVSIICKQGAVRNTEAASPVLASLKGKRFVTMAESTQYGRFDDEVIKQLTGGEEVTARNLYESAFTYLPQYTMWLSCNELPEVQGNSLFASDRIRIVELNRHFTGSERDTTLKECFRRDDSMSGIFNWLIAGYKEYMGNGLRTTAEMDNTLKKYEQDNDMVLLFLQERCIADGTSKTYARDLYEEYKHWCIESNYSALSARKFYNGIEQHPEWYSKTGITHGQKRIDGIRLRNTA